MKYTSTQKQNWIKATELIDVQTLSRQPGAPSHTTLRKWLTPAYKASQVKSGNASRRNNPEYHLYSRQLSRIHNAYKVRNLPIPCSPAKLLGCNQSEYFKHITNLLQPDMKLSNYGKGSKGSKGWNIDHIAPISAFAISNIKEAKLCFNFTNLQPLSHIDHIKKTWHSLG